MHIEISDAPIKEIQLYPGHVPDPYANSISLPLLRSDVSVVLENDNVYTGAFIEGRITTSKGYSVVTVKLQNGKDSTIHISGRIHVDPRQGLRQTS